MGKYEKLFLQILRGDADANVMHKYKLIVYWSAEDEVFAVDVPELPGCTAHGGTLSIKRVRSFNQERQGQVSMLFA